MCSGSIAGCVTSTIRTCSSEGSPVMNAPRTPHLESADQPPLVLPRDELHWYMDAVIYQLNVKAFFDSNDDGIGDFPGLTSKLGYVKDLGVNTIWLMPFYPSPLQGRRLRHLQLPRGQPAVRHARRLPQDARGGAPAGAARHHRAGHQPHLGPAPVVPGRAARAGGLGRARVLRLERRRHQVRGHAHHLHRHRDVQLDLGPGGQGLLLASLLQPPARPELRQPQGARGGVRHHALLARHGRRRLPARRDPLSHRARRHQQREPAGDACGDQAAARRHRRELPQPLPAGRGQPVARGRARVLRRGRRMPRLATTSR